MTNAAVFINKYATDYTNNYHINVGVFVCACVCVLTHMLGTFYYKKIRGIFLKVFNLRRQNHGQQLVKDKMFPKCNFV